MIGEAIARLKTGCKCLIIVDEKKLFGTLTDGDCHFEFKKTELNKSISKFYNKKPKYIQKRIYFRYC